MIGIYNSPTPYYISGIGPDVSGLHRTSGYGYDLIDIQNSEVHLMNFGINESPNRYTFAPPSAPPPYEINLACGRPHISSECGASVLVQGGAPPSPNRLSELSLHNMKITGSKGSAVGATKAHLRVSNTVFQDIGLYSLWCSNTLLGEIANNTFLSTRSAALFFSASGLADMPVRIIGNVFDGNHWGLDECGFPCAGGQIDFAGRPGPGGYTVRFAVLANNIIRNGLCRHPSYPQVPVVGVEFEHAVDSVAVLNNYIVRNIDGVLRTPTSVLTNVVISGNSLDNTLGNLVNLQEYASQNCQGPNCSWSIPVGAITGTRDNCGGPGCAWRIHATTQRSAIPLSPLLVCGSFSIVGSNGSASLALPGNIRSGTECSLYDSPAKLLLLARAWIP